MDRCPTVEEIVAINADQLLTFFDDPTAGTWLCRTVDGSADLTLLQKRAYTALVVMQHLQFNEPLPWTELALYSWFITAMDGIHFSSDLKYSSCYDPPGMINLVTSLFALETDRWLQGSVLDENVQGLMDLIIHEARHNQGYKHTCAGTLDQTIPEMGSFGVQYWPYVWLAYHSDPAFMTPGGTQPDLYRSLNRDQAVLFLAARQAGAGPFCLEATLTPGPTPTIPSGKNSHPGVLTTGST